MAVFFCLANLLGSNVRDDFVFICEDTECPRLAVLDFLNYRKLPPKSLWIAKNKAKKKRKKRVDGASVSILKDVVLKYFFKYAQMQKLKITNYNLYIALGLTLRKFILIKAGLF